MFFPPAMLHPALVLQRAFACLLAVATMATAVVPIDPLYGVRLHDTHRSRQCVSSGRSRNPHCQQSNDSKSNHNVAHCSTSSEEDEQALRQMSVRDVAGTSDLGWSRWSEIRGAPVARYCLAYYVHVTQKGVPDLEPGAIVPVVIMRPIAVTLMLLTVFLARLRH
jgi:hypothetical protein